MKEIIVDALMTLGSAAVVAAITCGVRLICAKISTEKQKAKKAGNIALINAFSTAESILTTVTNTVVGKIEQVSAGELRTLVKSGKADREALVALSKDAYNEIVATVQPEIMAQLTTTIKDSESYIMSLIEDAVRKVKLQSELVPKTEGGGSDA